MSFRSNAAHTTQYAIAASILAGGALCSLLIVWMPTPTPAAASLASVSTERFVGYLEDATPAIIDVRTPEEFATGHLPGAINIDYHDPDFTGKIAALDIREEYAIYCRSGNRSGKTLALMRDLGFHNVRNLSGGINSWLASGREACTSC